MTFESAQRAITRAAGDALNSAMTSAGESVRFVMNPPPGARKPVGVISPITENDLGSTKTTFAGEYVLPLRIYTTSDAKAKELATIAIRALVGHEKRLDLEPPFYQMSRATVEANSVIPERDERGDIFGADVRIRLRIGQHGG